MSLNCRLTILLKWWFVELVSVMRRITSSVRCYSGTGKSKLQEFKSLEKENERLKRIVADLELDKLILKESLDYLKPKA